MPLGLHTIWRMVMPYYWDNVTHPTTGQNFKFIVLSPQSTVWSTTSLQLYHIIADMIKRYRVDINRIYLTGLSAGGDGILQYIGHRGVDPYYLAAATVPMSEAGGYQPLAMGKAARDSNWCWGFSDPIGDIQWPSTRANMQYITDTAAALGIPVYSRFTSYSGGHCCWNTYYNPAYTENVGGVTMNIYQWMLTKTRNGIQGGGNQPPIVAGGPNQTITIPTSQVSLSGTAYDNDGTIVSILWTKIAGGSASITNPTSLSTTVTGLTLGSYVFRLTATDNSGATGSSDVTITVSSFSSSKTINVNIYGSAVYNNAQWNNWQTTNSLTSNVFNYTDGSASGLMQF